MLPNMQVLLEDVMFILQGEIMMSVGDATYPWRREKLSLNSQSDQLVGVSE